MPSICWNHFETTTRNNFQFYWSHPEFTDVTLTSEEGKEIKAHKIILCNGSTFFHKLFVNNHDTKYFNIDEIHPNITFKELEIIVKFIYLGQCEMETSEFESVLSVGRDLGIIGLIESQENFVIHFPCNICNYKATDYDSLTKHIENIHTEIKYICNHCKYKSIDGRDLTNHIKMIHMRDGYCCDHCKFITTKSNDIKGYRRTLPREVKAGRKKEKIEWARSKVISRNCLNNVKDPETMSIDEVEKELQTYMEGETDEERSDYYAAARKRARDRLVKTHYRDVKKPGKIDNILIKVDMLKDFRKNGKKPISIKRLQKKKYKTAKMSNKNSIQTESLKDTTPYTENINVITTDIQKVSNINQSFQGEDDPTQHITKNYECLQDIQEIKENNYFVETVNGETTDPQDVNDIKTLQSVNDITTNRQEVNDVNPNIQIIHDIHPSPQETHNTTENLQEFLETFLETVYNTPSYNETNMNEQNDFFSHLPQESNITAHSHDVNHAMELDDTSVIVEEVNRNIPQPQESNYVSSILQEAMDISFNEMENTHNTQDQTYHYTFSFDDMEEVSSNLLFSLL